MNILCFLGIHKLSEEVVDSPPGFIGRPCIRCSYVKLLKPPSIFASINTLELGGKEPPLKPKESEKEQSTKVVTPSESNTKRTTVRIGAIGHKKVSYTVTSSNKPPELIEFTVRFRVTKVTGKEITTSVLSVQGTKEPRHREVVLENWIPTFNDLRGITWE